MRRALAVLFIAVIGVAALVAVVRSSVPPPGLQAGQAPSASHSSADRTAAPDRSLADAPEVTHAVAGGESGESGDAAPSSDPFRFHAIPRDLVPDPVKILSGGSSKDVECDGGDPCGP